MDYIQKLPFILGAAIAIIVGLLSNYYGVAQQDTYFRMAISMTVFFIIGVYLKNTIIKIQDELDEKKLEEERKIKLELEHTKIEEEEKAKEHIQSESKNLGSTVDLKVTDEGEDFLPLTVDEYFKKEN